jgi:hypothetical protein
MKLLGALQFTSDTSMYLHQLPKCCGHSNRFRLIHLRLYLCFISQYACSIPQIVKIIQRENLFTLTSGSSTNLVSACFDYQGSQYNKHG